MERLFANGKDLGGAKNGLNMIVDDICVVLTEFVDVEVGGANSYY